MSSRHPPWLCGCVFLITDQPPRLGSSLTPRETSKKTARVKEKMGKRTGSPARTRTTAKRGALGAGPRRRAEAPPPPPSPPPPYSLSQFTVCLVTPFVITYLSACVCFCASLLLTYQLRVNTMFHSLLNPQALNQYIEGTQYVFIEKMNTKIAMWLNMVIRQEHFYTCKKKSEKRSHREA